MAKKKANKISIDSYNPEDTYYFTDEVICGLDLSLNKTGVMVLNAKGDIIHQECIDIDEANKVIKENWKIENKDKLKSKEYTVKNDYNHDLKSMPRLSFIKERILEILKEFKVTKIAIEGYSFSSRGRSVFDLGELGGAIRLALYENSYAYVDVSPSSVKAFIIIGNADKEQMRLGIISKYGHNFENDNIADAFALARFLLCFGDAAEDFSGKGGAAAIKKLRETYEIK